MHSAKISLTDEELNVLTTDFYPRIPAQILSSLLGTNYPTLMSRRKKLGLAKPGKGCGPKVITFISKYKEENFKDLRPDLQGLLKRLWFEALRSATAKRCTTPPQANECDAAVALYCYRPLFPGTVWKEFFGLSEKSFYWITKALKLKITADETNHAAGIVRYDYPLPEMDRLTSSQIHRLRNIVESHRAQYWSDYRKKSSAHAAQILAQMRSAAKKAWAPPTPCRGRHCKASWPRKRIFFAATHDTADGLQRVCKYCSYLNVVERRMSRRLPGPEKKRSTKLLTVEVTNRAVEILPKLVGVVPTCYVQKLLGITPKQFSRLLSLAKTKVPAGIGETILLRWRLYTDATFPKLNFLRSTERERLLEIWRTDKDRWTKNFEESDRENLQDMENETATLERNSSPVCKEPKIACVGGCGKRWYKDKFFFPTQAGKLKHYCRHCNIKHQRVKSHMQKKGS